MADSGKKKLIGNVIKKNIFPILILSFSGAVIYMLPYFRYEYYDAYLATYNLTNTQMGLLGSIYGVFGAVSYLFGGYVADKVSVKLLLSVSLICTGLGGFIHLLPLGFGSLAVLYGAWGFTSLFAFWPASVKAVRMMAEPSDQGKAFGVFEGGRGLCAALIASAAVLCYAIGDRNGEIAGMRALLVYYGIATIAAGLLVLLFFKENKMVQAEDDNRIVLADVGKVLKLPAMWIIAMVTLCGYVFTMSIYYLTPYSTNFLGLSVVAGAGVAAFRRYVSPVASAGGGFMIDKVGSSGVFLTSFLVMAAGVVAIFLLPLNNSVLIPFLVLYLLVYFFYCVNYGLTYAMMGEGNIPLKLSGTAAGVICTIGYLPEIFCAPIAGALIDSNENSITGYRIYFTFVVAMLLLGAVFTLIWKRFVKRNKTKQAAGEGAPA